MLLQRVNNLLYRLRRACCPTPYESLSRDAVYPSFTAEQLQSGGYNSQYGQDKWVHETILAGVKQGVFVDLGAHDGVTFSNTCHFEKQLGWTGLCVEPNPDVFAKLDQNRRCHKVQGAVGPKPGRAQFQVLTGATEMLSGLKETYDDRHLDRIQREQQARGGEQKLIDVEVYTLGDLLAKYDLPRVDYLTIDTEGAEMAILESFDFARFDVRVIGLENNYKDARLPALMAKHGYQFHSVLGDEFYVKR